MIRPSLRRGRGLASYYVTASLLWLAGIIAVTAPLAAGDLRAVVSGGARWPDPARRLDVPGCYEIYGPEEVAMITDTTVQALGQARLADRDEQARRDALVRAARRTRRGRRWRFPGMRLGAPIRQRSAPGIRCLSAAEIRRIPAIIRERTQRGSQVLAAPGQRLPGSGGTHSVAASREP
jgi:hypothetical protein